MDQYLQLKYDGADALAESYLDIIGLNQSFLGGLDSAVLWNTLQSGEDWGMIAVHAGKTWAMITGCVGMA